MSPSRQGTGSGGPLVGVRVVEVASLAPGPFAAGMLADMGADVVRVDRASGEVGIGGGGDARSLLTRGRRSVAIDLKAPDGAALLRSLAGSADVLIEGFRPGVMERLGVGPEVCLEDNPALVYGRMTGFGQDGPLALAAGHDIDYIALGGALGMIGREGQPPTPPLNLVGDFGGGGLLLAFGIVCALIEARHTGRGQVVDAAMVDGTSILMLPFFGSRDTGGWGERGTNMLDSGAHFYDTYETADGRWLAVGAIEPQFYACLLAGLGIDPASVPPQMDRQSWPSMKARLAGEFRGRTRDEWCEIFDGTDACVAPVLDLTEVDTHPHAAARDAYVEVAGIVQPAPAPRLGATPARVSRRPPTLGEHTDEVLEEWLGLGPERVGALRASGAIA